MLRVVVREDFTRNRCDALIGDIEQAMRLLEQMDKASVQKQQEYIHKHQTASAQAKHNHPKYKVCSLFPPRRLRPDGLLDADGR